MIIMITLADGIVNVLRMDTAVGHALEPFGLLEWGRAGTRAAGWSDGGRDS